jgi:flagellar biosynthesis GTPase FlhF
MKDTLRIKTYFATSVESAMTLARRELGAEAMLLNSRPSPTEARHLGPYEVVFATVPDHSPPTLLRANPQPYLPGRELSADSLMDAGFERQLAERIVAAHPLSPVDFLATLVQAEPVLAELTNGREMAALIGPSGRGKTTTLVKLAIANGLAQRKPVRIYSADYLRIGASAPLRTLAGILGVTFESFESPAALNHALTHAMPGLTLIDTPGFGPRDHDAAQALARVLTAQPVLSVHLVLRADTTHTALSAAIERFACFRPARLLFTGLDEAPHLGSMFSAAVGAQLPISFLTNGQSIPEDLEPASIARVVDLALGSFSRASLVAA